MFHKRAVLTEMMLNNKKALSSYPSKIALINDIATCSESKIARLMKIYC